MVATNLVGSIQLIPWSLSSSWQVYRARCTRDGSCAKTRTPVRRIRNDGAISLNGRRPRLNGRLRQLMERSQFRVGDPTYLELVSTPGLRATVVVDRATVTSWASRSAGRRT